MKRTLPCFATLQALLFMAGIWLLAAPVPVLGAEPFAGTPYCILPPGAGTTVKSNLLLMLDNSASMWDLAYDRGKHCSGGVFPPSPCSGDADCAGSSCVGDSDPYYCFDDSYQDANSYGGYFDEKTVYRYDTDHFLAEGTAPLTVSSCSSAPCVASKTYLYLEMAGSSPNRTVQLFKASGKFLNWLTMSKLDIEKQALTGGKYDASGGVLIGESRGCQGKKFVKVASAVPQVTFAVGGPIPPYTGYPYEYPPSAGGATRIEVYDKAYNKTACLSAVKDWRSGAGNPAFRNDAKNCMGPEFLIQKYQGRDLPSAEQTFLDIHSACFVTTGTVLGDGVTTADCTSRSRYLYLNGGTLNTILKFAGDDICGNYITYTKRDGTVGTRGYIGTCYLTLNWPSCETQAKDYCALDPGSPVVDPSVTAFKSGTSNNVPSFVLDAGIYGLGKVAATLMVRVSVPSPPTGLLQEFGNDLNLGLMVFNPNGAAAECGSVTIPCAKHCRLNPASVCSKDSDCAVTTNYGPCLAASDGSKLCKLNTGMSCPAGDSDCISSNSGPCDGPSDGGLVLSHINDSATTLGDHTRGLISTVDSVSATNWSPLAESFYDAIGYFAHRTTPMWLQAGDYDNSKPPSQYSCQRNNVLIVSDGISTADRRSEVNQLVANWQVILPAGLTTSGSESSPPFQGSYNLDDLAWLARHRNIADFSTDTASSRDYITTYVVYTGVPCGAYNSDGSCQTSDEGVPEKLMQLTATKGGGRIASAQNPSDLGTAFRQILQDVAAGSMSDPTLVASGDGNGALYLQERFYPSKSFDGGASSASWLGEMQSLWYYIDPFLDDPSGAGSSIREDTSHDYKLNLKTDRIVTLDPATNLSYATVDLNGDGSGGGSRTQVDLDQLQSLWRAGQELWKRDLAAAPRQVKTTINGSSLIDFSADNAATLADYLNVPAADAGKLVGYILGTDQTGYRNRTVQISDPVSGSTASGVWRLGDIVSSTPQVQSPTALGAYQLPAPRGYNDASYASFVRSSDYQNRGMVYVGANDGMLHAFNLGTLDTRAASGDVKATLSGSDLGKEIWAFIPKHALPYLKYLADPDYRHLYYVDGKLALFDASIGDGNAWRTVLIGGMGLGGASAKTCPAGSDCVQTPVSDLGYSSYFALDVTNPSSPSLLWEFSDPDLGYATSGPAIVKSGGKWFAVFGSGPTGPVDAVNHQFQGRSRQTLKFFIVELRTGAVSRIETGIENAFAGSMSGAAIDADKWNPSSPGFYSDDALYVGYTKDASKGGVLRIVTGEKDPALSAWSFSNVVDGTGPVTGGIARIQDRKNHHLWLYFGTGRYFFGQDDVSGKRALYGVKEPCYNYTNALGVVARPDGLDPTCSQLASVGNPGDVQTTTPDGWRIDLDPPSGSLGAERVIGTPTAVSAGAVFFPSFQPASDPCGAGTSYLWQVMYDSGAALSAGAVHGKALMAVSSGGTQETALDKGGRRGAGVTGKPGGVKVITNSGLKPLKKIIHIQER